MLKRKIDFIVGLVLMMVLAVSCNSNSVELPPLAETFSHKDKNPFGAFVLHHQLEQLYYHNTVRNIETNFDKTWANITDTGAVYINVSKNLFLLKGELKGMLNYVYNGNTLFIASDHIDQQLLDTLGCAVVKGGYGQFPAGLKYTAVKLAGEIFNDTSDYKYYYLPFFNHFTKMDTLHSKVLGTNYSGVNFLLVFYGKGRFYLHTEPRALSNYFLLQKNNHQYFQHIFSLTPAIPQHVYWDDYYNKKNYPESGNRSGLAVLLQYPAMAWGFWLLLLLFGLYIFFEGKRRQRIVETIPPNTNTTLNFTETIGRLYLQKKDNRNIADKIITYFLEHIRNQFYLNTSHINDEFIATLSRKSNNTSAGVSKLFKSIRTVQQSMEVSDQDLLFLNQQVENFYKNNL